MNNQHCGLWLFSQSKREKEDTIKDFNMVFAISNGKKKSTLEKQL